MGTLIYILTFILILISAFLILVVLMQKSKDGGMGAALGGGMTESAFGAETGNVLSKATINATIAFFVLSFVLYLAFVYQHKHSAGGDAALPNIPAPAAVAPATVPAGTAPTAAAPAATPAVTLPAAPAPATQPAAPAPAEPKKP
jgi:preprotein translocase subunit SecG